jgi:lycopene cyclase domain-containing protein
MFGQWSYMAMLLFVVFGSWWLEWGFKIRVLRNPIRLITTILLVAPWFIVWDAYAISQGHWFFDRDQILGIYGPLEIPIEEYLFFILIPIAAILTMEGTRSAYRMLLAYQERRRELVSN